MTGNNNNNNSNDGRNNKSSLTTTRRNWNNKNNNNNYAVYRFHCRGIYSMRDDNVGSKGFCYGIQSRLQKVKEIRSMERNQAIQEFQQGVENDDYCGNHDDDDQQPIRQKRRGPQTKESNHHNTDLAFHGQENNSSNNNNRNNKNNHVDLGSWNPQTMIYGLMGEKQQQQQQEEEDEEDDDSLSILKKQQPSVTTTTTPEFRVTDLHAFGSTHVHVLVGLANDRRSLQRQQQLREGGRGVFPPSLGVVLGLSADCRHGVHFVSAATSKAREQSTFEMIASMAPWMSRGLHIRFSPNQPTPAPSDMKNNHDRKPHYDKEQSAAASSRDVLQQQQEQERRRQMTTRYDHANPTDMTTMARRFGEKWWKAIKSNAVLLSQSFSNDFPQRMLHSSHKIVGQFGKTYDRTTKLMGSVYRLWAEDDDDDDDEDY